MSANGRPERIERPEFVRATKARAAAFTGFRAPMENGTGDPRKAYPKGVPEDVQARAAKVKADIAKADAEHPWVVGADGRMVRS